MVRHPNSFSPWALALVKILFETAANLGQPLVLEPASRRLEHVDGIFHCLEATIGLQFLLYCELGDVLELPAGNFLDSYEGTNSVVLLERALDDFGRNLSFREILSFELKVLLLKAVY